MDNGAAMNKPEEKDFATFAKEWHDMMVRIWTDRIETMDIHRTGTLQNSVNAQGFNVDAEGFSMQAAYRFVEYGIYVDAGTGNGYSKGNGGDLKILDPVERAKRGLGEPRKKRPWFSVSWEISKKVLNRRLTQGIGREFAGLFDNLER